MSSSATDDKSNKTEVSLDDTNADEFVRRQLKSFPGESFKFGSTYPFSRKSLQKLASNLSTLNLTGIDDSFSFSDNIKK